LITIKVIEIAIKKEIKKVTIRELNETSSETPAIFI